MAMTMIPGMTSSCYTAKHLPVCPNPDWEGAAVETALENDDIHRERIFSIRSRLVKHMTRGWDRSGWDCCQVA